MHNLPMMCMNRQFDTQIGETIQKVMDVDVEDNDTGQGKLLRVRIEVDLKKTLARRRSINVRGETRQIPFKNEKLPELVLIVEKLDMRSITQ